MAPKKTATTPAVAKTASKSVTKITAKKSVASTPATKKSTTSAPKKNATEKDTATKELKTKTVASTTKKAVATKKTSSVSTDKAPKKKSTTTTTSVASAASKNGKKATSTKSEANVDAVKMTTVNGDDLPFDVTRKYYNIDKNGRAYRTYKLVMFDGKKPDIEHCATQNTEFPLNHEKYKTRSKGYSFGLGPRNAASKILTSICSHDKGILKTNPKHTLLDVVNTARVLVIQETTRNSKQNIFTYGAFRVPKDDINYAVNCDAKTGKAEKMIAPKFTNKLYAMANADAEIPMTPQTFAKNEAEKSKTSTTQSLSATSV